MFASLAFLLWTFAVICLDYTKLGQTKVFCFIAGETMFVTVIAYIFSKGISATWFTPFVITIWFTIGSVFFAKAIWYINK